MTAATSGRTLQYSFVFTKRDRIIISTATPLHTTTKEIYKYGLPKIEKTTNKQPNTPLALYYIEIIVFFGSKNNWILTA